MGRLVGLGDIMNMEEICDIVVVSLCYDGNNEIANRNLR